jgi:hypothetical protein
MKHLVPEVQSSGAIFNMSDPGSGIVGASGLLLGLSQGVLTGRGKVLEEVRDVILDIQGRSRKRQIELAGLYNIKEYETPAGGCVLTDKNFARRLRDLFTNDPKPSLRDYQLLRTGRHLRFSKTEKFILGRRM